MCAGSAGVLDPGDCLVGGHVRDQPDFVVVGSRVKEGVILWASNSLTRLELESRVDTDGMHTWGNPGAVRHVPYGERHELRAELRCYVTVIAATYAQAWQKLFDEMSPPAWKDEQTQAQIVTHYLFNDPANTNPGGGYVGPYSGGAQLSGPGWQYSGNIGPGGLR